MDYRRLGRSELMVSPVGLGLWQAGGDGSWGADCDEGELVAAIHAAPDAGINLLDTAPAYGGGGSEELLGRAVVGRRDRYVVATKLNTNVIRRAAVREAVEGSLRRLRCEWIDLLQIHWPNSQGEPFAETIAAMEELRAEGKLRALGVSNFNAQQLAECLSAGRIDSLQPPYNLLWRHVEAEVLPFCRAHELAVLTYSPLAQGLLSGKYDRSNRPQDGTRPRNLLWHGQAFDVALAVVAELRAVAERHQASCAQVALAWLLHQPGVTCVLAGAKRPQQVADNARAGALRLSDAEVAALSAAGEPLRALTAGEPKMWFTGQAGAYDVR